MLPVFLRRGSGRMAYGGQVIAQGRAQAVDVTMEVVRFRRVSALTLKGLRK
jgi:hypothetical protein